MRRDGLEKSIGLLLLGGVLALAGLGFAAREQFTVQQSTVDLATGSRRTITVLDGLTRALLDAETGQRGYLLTAQAEYLTPYDSGVEEAQKRIKELNDRLELRVTQADAVARLNALATRKLDELSQTISLHDQNRQAEAMAIVQRNEGKRLMDEIRTLSAEMLLVEQARLDHRLAAARNARASTQIMFWMALAALMTISGVAFWPIRRELRRRLAVTDALHESQARLQASEHRMKAMADALPALIGYVDRTETYRFTNSRYDSFFDAAPDAFIGRSMLEVMGPQAHADLRDEIAGALGGTRQTFERQAKEAGRDVHVLVNYVPDIDAHGTVSGFYVLVMDITERKTAELQQQFSERRLKAITDNVPAIVAHLDRDQRYLLANDQFRRLFDADPAELVGQRLADVRGVLAYAQIAPHLPAVLNGEVRRFEVRDLIRGEEHYMQHSLIPDIDAAGAVQGFYSVAFDITDLRRAEDALRASKEFLSRTGRVAGVGGWAVDIAKSTVTWSQETRRIHDVPENYGPTLESAIGFYAPEARLTVEHAVRHGIETGQSWDLELPMVTATGRSIWVRAVGDVEFEQGQAVRLVGAFQDITNRKLAELKFAASERRLRLVTDNLPALVAHIDHDQRYTFVNEHFRRIFGIDPSTMLGRTIREVRGDAVYDDIRPRVERALSGVQVIFESSGMAPDGEHHYRSEYVPDVDDQGLVVGFYAMTFDFTDRRRAELALAAKERMLRTITDNLPVFIAYVDRDEKVPFVNATGKSWLGVAHDALLDGPLIDVLGPEGYDQSAAQTRRALSGERLQFEMQTEWQGRQRYLRHIYVPDLQPDGSVSGVFTLMMDITDLKDQQQRLDELARVDTLTGLPNRRQFDEKLEDALLRGQRDGRCLAVMFLDIDHFKAINDSLGHAAGDAVLREFGARLKASVRETDVAARLAGDEFVVLLDGLSNEQAAARVARKIIDAIRVDFDVSGAAVKVTTSLGVAFSSTGERGSSVTAQALLTSADDALYEAKRGGRDGFRISSFTTVDFDITM